MSLTDEQLLKLWAPEPSRPVMGRNKILEFARAIESSATAPLLERIAELERELEALRKDGERWAMSHLVSKEALTPPEKRQHQNVLNAYFKATGAGLDWVAAIDAAIDAAKDQG